MEEGFPTLSVFLITFHLGRFGVDSLTTANRHTYTDVVYRLRWGIFVPGDLGTELGKTSRL